MADKLVNGQWSIVNCQLLVVSGFGYFQYPLPISPQPLIPRGNPEFPTSALKRLVLYCGSVAKIEE
ncbi:hypothetical protein NIES592_13055 [Fischerella major NIES-592]|uniref:Uncharacterized protein n=1 Tax=Fischerella major NIES-592 TaxID=210994 RepID=A0A1U7GYM6_9CYAN|nr:hypothetical protein NIES592_13055 [Fischerella major NIES-592]